MKKLLIIGITLISFVACGTNNEKKSLKQSEEDLRTAIVGSWYIETGQPKLVPDSSNVSTTHSVEVKGRMGMRKEFFKDGRYMERENSEMILNGDTASFLIYSIRGKWEIHSDSLFLFANMEDIENPERAGITAKSGQIKAIKIIKRITADSLIIQDGVHDMNGNVLDLIMLKVKDDVIHN